MTAPESPTPTVRPSSLVTVAYLKAQLDEGNDHLGIFLPLVLDILPRLGATSFTAAEVQGALLQHHGIAMPQSAVTTLLRRATKKKYIKREAGLYRVRTATTLPRTDVRREKDHIEKAQTRMAEALRVHAMRRGLTVKSTDDALQLLYRFLTQEQVGLLLGAPASGSVGPAPTSKERAVTAEFINAIVREDPALRAVLNSILAGLVLYEAAFLPDLNSQSRQFHDLKIAFDSTLIRQALGYEGQAMRALLRETIGLLTAAGARCVAFDKTLDEIRRILRMYEAKLATAEGRRSLRPVPMARHFLTEHYSPSDAREMSALLDRDVAAAGFGILDTPVRVAEYTANEGALARRLADPRTQDELEPRVQHDVDCVAAVLTLRRGRTSTSIEDARAVFATTSRLVIHNTRLWYQEDESGTGWEPVVHVSALANLAWLKKPHMAVTLKEREVVALCAGALRPRPETWQRFLRHLDSLERSDRLTSDEAAAIVASAMSDELLRELETDDETDVDAATLDDVIARVKASYAAEAEQRMQDLRRSLDEKLQETTASGRAAEDRAQAAAEHAEEVERQLEQQAARIAELRSREHANAVAAEAARRAELGVDRRARALAKAVSVVVHASLGLLVSAGATALIVGYPFHAGVPGILVGMAVVTFVALEALGILRHVRDLRTSMNAKLTVWFRAWLSGQ